jgi:hypothetical protein
MKPPLINLTLDQLRSPGVLDFIQEASCWAVAPISESPDIVLIRWQVMQLPNADLHFVGWNVKDSEGRASTRIIEFDPSTRSARTDSGRIYQLVGPAGRDSNGMYVWRRWMKINAVTEYADVSAHFQAQIEAAESHE